MPVISDAILKQLQDDFAAIQADHDDESSKTDASNAADSAAQQAISVAAQAKLDETTATNKTKADIAALKAVIDDLAASLTPTP